MDGARSGQWTPEEVSFASRLIDEFRNGSLDLVEGTSMRGFLADKLGCVPKRISKKYENTKYNGRLQYVRDKNLSAEHCVRCRLELEKMERAFRESIQEGEGSKEATKTRKSKASNDFDAQPIEVPKGKRQPQAQLQLQEERTQKQKYQQLKDLKLMQQQFHHRQQSQQHHQQPKQQQQQQQNQQQNSQPQHHQQIPVCSLSSSSSDVSQQWQPTSAAATSGTTRAGFLAVANLERSLKRNAEATCAANDELLSLLAARQRLARQSLSLKRTKLRQEGNSNLANVARSNQVFTSLSSLQQRQQQAPPTLPQPPPVSHASQNSTASNFERLRFLQQIELEQRQRNRLLASTPSTHSSQTVPTAGTSQWKPSVGHEQAKLLAVANDTQKKAPRRAGGSLLASGFIAHAARKQAQQEAPATAALLAARIPLQDGGHNNSFKRKQAPTELLADPMRPRNFY